MSLRLRTYGMIAGGLLLAGLGLVVLSKSSVPTLRPEPTPEPLALAHFANRQDSSADASHSARLLRGGLVSLTPEDSTVTLQTWVAFPNKTITRDISLRTTQRTQFRCWRPTQDDGNGNTIHWEDAAILLTDSEKLSQAGEIPLSAQQVVDELRRNTRPSALIALTKPFRTNTENVAYQVILLGCSQYPH